MSNIVWSAENGWHNGPAATIAIDDRGRITATATIPVSAADLASLTDDGDTIELADGRVLRLKVEPDPHPSIMDEQGEGVWCGRIEWDNGRENAYGWRMRPDGFTGRAEVIERDWHARLWWEVPADIVIGSDTHHNLRQSILDLYRYGYCQVGLVLECEHGGELDSAWVGGCDNFYPELVTDLVTELDWSPS